MVAFVQSPGFHLWSFLDLAIRCWIGAAVFVCRSSCLHESAVRHLFGIVARRYGSSLLVYVGDEQMRFVPGRFNFHELGSFLIWLRHGKNGAMVELESAVRHFGFVASRFMWATMSRCGLSRFYFNHPLFLRLIQEATESYGFLQIGVFNFLARFLTSCWLSFEGVGLLILLRKITYLIWQ